MKQQNTNSKLNQRTREFVLERTGQEITESEAQEIRHSLVQYCRLLIEISQNQPEEKHARAVHSR